MFAGIKLFLGVDYRSVWFGTLAVYYGMMAMIRFVLLRHVSRAGIGEDIRAEFKYYRLCGVISPLDEQRPGRCCHLGGCGKTEGFIMPGT